MESQEREERKDLTGAAKRGHRIEVCGIYLLFAALGALFCGAALLEGVYPFGLALAAAAGKVFPAVAAGAALFGIWTADYAALAALGVVALCRIGWSMLPNPRGKNAMFAERVGLRMLAAVAGVLFDTGLAWIYGDFRYHYLVAMLLGIAAAVLCTWVLSGLFLTRDALFPYSREAGLGALVLLGIFAMRGVEFSGIYPAAVCGMLVALWLSAHYGWLLGGIGGLLAGLCFEMTLAPAFFACGVGFALLQKSSRGGGILTGCALAAVYSFGVHGVAGIALLLPSLLAAGALFLAGDSLGVIEGSPVRREAMARKREAARAAKEMESAHNENQLRALSGTLSDLSGLLYDLGGKQRRPGQLDLRHLCDREFDKVCPQCPRREICWGSEYQATAGAVAALGEKLYRTGRAELSGMPEGLVGRCTQLPQVLERINDAAQQMYEEALHGDKTSVVAMDYAAMGRMLTDTLEQGEDGFCVDEALGDRITARLQRMGYTLDGACVCGKTRRRVLLRGLKLPGRRIKVRELRATLEQSCKFELGEATVREEGGKEDYLFPERTKFRCLTVKQSRAKGEKETGHCGDSVISFSDTQSRSFALLCDGMGSGSGAALTSALCATVLSRLLQAGNRPETSLRMLNGVLSARAQRENEASSTVDLLEVDGVSGEGRLYKCGAAPTYLLRAGQTTRFFSRTAPVGILESLDAERISFSVQSGDVLVQLSDGISGGEESCPWLEDMLKNRWDGEAEKFARLVLNRASENGGDDLSVMITEISDAPAPGTEAA